MAFLGLIGAVASAAGSIVGGIAQGSAAHYQAQVARNNAVEAAYQSTYASQAGREKAMIESLKGGDEASKVKASMAANGVDVNSGSAVNVQTSEAEKNALNTETVANNAALQSYGYRVQQSNFNAQADLYQQEANMAPITGALGAAGSLLGNANAVNGFSSLWTSS